MPEGTGRLLGMGGACVARGVGVAGPRRLLVLRVRS